MPDRTGEHPPQHWERMSPNTLPVTIDSKLPRGRPGSSGIASGVDNRDVRAIRHRGIRESRPSMTTSHQSCIVSQHVGLVARDFHSLLFFRVRPRAAWKRRARSRSVVPACRVLAGVVAAVAVAAAVAEVDAAGQLAHDQQVDAARCAPSRSGLAPASAGLGRTGRRLAKSPSALRRPEQALLGTRRVGVGGVPLRPADRAEQHRVGAAAGLQHLVGQGDPVLVDRAPSHQPLVELELPQSLQ